MKQEGIITLLDFKEVPLPEKLLEIPLKTSLVDVGMKEMAERFLTIEEADDEIRQGDIVVFEVLEAEKEEERYLRINIGKNFYDEAWEQSVIGSRKGQEVMLPDEGAHRKAVVCQMKRRILPEITDELVTRLNLPEVQSVEDYRKYLEEKLIQKEEQKRAEILVNYITKKVASESHYTNLEEQLRQATEKRREEYRKRAEEMGMTYEELIANSLPKNLKTPEEQEKGFKDLILLEMKVNLAAERFCAEQGITTSREEYETEMQQYRQMGLTEEQLASFTYEAYEVKKIYGMYAMAIQEYCMRKFKVVRV